MDGAVATLATQSKEIEKLLLAQYSLTLRDAEAHLLQADPKFKQTILLFRGAEPDDFEGNTK
jgi:hypothetical protein